VSASATNPYHPWPIHEFRARLCSRDPDTLSRLCQQGIACSTHDTREHILEGLARDLMSRTFSQERVRVRQRIRTTLGPPANAPFPARTLPDIVLDLDGTFHICELKSSRTAYGRFDCVFDSQPLRDYLTSQGHNRQPPWEVEQDLIKLRRFHTLSPRVGSCLFLMVDAYTGSDSWARVFSNADRFARTMRTDLVRGWAQELVDSTTIEPIEAGSTRAKLIVCKVRPLADGPAGAS
jgi:hypothetical protein